MEVDSRPSFLLNRPFLSKLNRRLTIEGEPRLGGEARGEDVVSAAQAIEEVKRNYLLQK